MIFNIRQHGAVYENWIFYDTKYRKFINKKLPMSVSQYTQRYAPTYRKKTPTHIVISGRKAQTY